MDSDLYFLSTSIFAIIFLYYELLGSLVSDNEEQSWFEIKKGKLSPI